MGCRTITTPADVLNKLPPFGSKTAENLSLEAVRLFHEDAQAAGLTFASASVAPASKPAAG
jgi:transaldolase